MSLTAAIIALALVPQEGATQKPWKPGYEAGDFTFYPRAGTRLQYDDNINLESKDKDADFIVQPWAGLKLTLDDKDEVSGSLDYEYTEWYHEDKTVANRDEQSGRVGLTWDPGDVYFRFGGGFNVAAQPIDTAFAQLVEVRVWTGSIAAGYDIEDSRFELSTDFLDLSTPLDALEFFEHNQLSFTGKALHRFEEDVAGSVDFTYGRTHFPNGDFAPVKEDANWYQGRVGAIWVVSEEVEVSGNVGWQRRDYETGNGVPAFAHDYEGGIFEGSVSWVPGAEHRLTGRVYRGVRESVLSNYLSTYGATLVYSYIISKGWDVSFIGTGERGRESTDAVAEEMKWRFSGKVVTYYRFLDPLTDEATPVQGELSVEYRGKQTDDQTSEYENWRATAGVRFDF